MKSRFAILFLVFACLWGALVFRGTSLKLFPGDRLRALQKRQFETSLVLHSRRGAILDAKERDLAVSVASYSLFADPKLIQEKTKIARVLAKYLKQSQKSVFNKIKSKT
ncbi:MAG: cell division protein, partial [Bdellovibrionales bacterium]|nr:cell division protein [Bdellovibrionales bacterium]